MNIYAIGCWRRQLLVVALAVVPGLAHGADSADESTVIRRMPAETLRTVRPELTRSLAERIAFEGWRGRVEDLKVFDLAGRDLTAQAKPEVVDGRLTVANPQKMQLVMKTRDIKTVKAVKNQAVLLPGGIVVPDRDAPSSGGTPSGSWLRLTLLASPTPADWDASAGRYVTRVTFGLKNPDDARENIDLDRPVTVKLGFEGLTGPEVPPLTIDAPGLEHEKTVDLSFVPRTPNPRLLIRSTISDADLELEALPRLELAPASDHVPGFGLGIVNVTLTHVLPHGDTVTAAEPTDVVVEVEGGSVQSGPIVLNAGEATTSFNVRSGGLGLLRVQASAGGVWGETSVEQRLFGPLLAALLGGALGGYTRRFVRGARRKLATRRIVEGLIVGVVAFVAGALGVGYFNLPAMLVATEAGAFLTGVLAGFAGVTVLEVLTRRLRPGGA